MKACNVQFSIILIILIYIFIKVKTMLWNSLLSLGSKLFPETFTSNYYMNNSPFHTKFSPLIPTWYISAKLLFWLNFQLHYDDSGGQRRYVYFNSISHHIMIIGCAYVLITFMPFPQIMKVYYRYMNTFDLVKQISQNFEWRMMTELNEWITEFMSNSWFFK